MFSKILRNNQVIYLLCRRLRMLLKYRLWGGYRGVHQTANFLGSSRISKDIVAGPYSSIGPMAWIGPKVEIGKYVLIAPNLTIAGDDHLYDQVGTPVIFSGRPPIRKTIIEDDVWVGKNVSICAGVVVGRGSILAMGAVIAKDVEPYSIVGGVPAKVIGRRFESRDDEQKHDRMLKESAQPGVYCSGKK
ncbi:MAG: DapH/DapD/GlmU-related protein [Lentimonas sp.]